MERIKIYDKYFRTLIPYKEIQKNVTRIAKELNLEYPGKEAPLFVPVLNGSFMFVADLVKQLTFQAQISFVKISSYSGTQSSGNIKMILGAGIQIKGREVIIVEDIVDTGNTVRFLSQMLLKEGAAHVKICTLLMKPEAYKHDMEIDYIAMKIPDSFVVGYGLDYDELGRQYKDIYILDEDQNEKNKNLLCI